MATTNRELAKAAMREFDRFFNGEFPLTAALEKREFGWVPEMEVFENNNRLTVRLDAPGLEREELTVNVAEGWLAVKGERKHETEEEKTDWYRRERTYGRFYRTVPLPEGVNAREVEATFKNGVLEVTVPLPKGKSVAPHTVEVHAPDEKETVAAS